MAKKRTKQPKSEAPSPGSRTQNLEDLRAAKEEWSLRLFKRPQLPPLRAFTVPVTPDPVWNVQGVGIGEKLVDGRHSGVLAVKFLVRVKYHSQHVSRKHSLPKSVAGLPTDVEEVGLFRRFQGGGKAPVSDPRTKIRPARPGCSVGFADPSNQLHDTGTFGALVRDSNGVYILSGNHVLADENQLALGSPVFQPALPDGGNQNTDRIARLTRFVPLQSNASNWADCAIAAVSDPSQVSSEILQIGSPQGVGQAQQDMMVHKFGRATHYRVGQVSTIDANVFLPYLTGTFQFNGQIIIVGLNGDAFSDSGDSGALVLERNTNIAIGLIIAGSSSHTIASPISNVLASLGVTLA